MQACRGGGEHGVRADDDLIAVMGQEGKIWPVLAEDVAGQEVADERVTLRAVQERDRSGGVPRSVQDGQRCAVLVEVVAVVGQDIRGEGGEGRCDQVGQDLAEGPDRGVELAASSRRPGRLVLVYRYRDSEPVPKSCGIAGVVGM